MPKLCNHPFIVCLILDVLLFAMMVAIVFAAVAILAGCNGKASADYRSHELLRDPHSGAIVYERNVGTGSTQELPPNASGPTTQSVSEDGVGQSMAGQHETTPEQIIAQNGRVFYIAAALFAVLAVVAFGVLKSVPLGIAAGVAAAACAATPIFLNQVGPWLLPIGGLIAVAALVWAMVNRHASLKSSQLAGAELAGATAAADSGDVVTALDKMRTAVGVLKVNKPHFAKAVDMAASSTGA